MQDQRVPSLVIAGELALFRDGIAALCELSGRAKVLAVCEDGEDAWRQIEIRS